MIDLKPACQAMADVLVRVTDSQFTNPTPCSEYTVADLIAHVDEVATGFGAMAGGEVSSGVVERVLALGKAWDSPSAWQGSSVAAGLELPTSVWGKIALTEIVVHGWDLAKATGQPFDLPEDTLRACYEHVVVFVPEAPIPSLWGPRVFVGSDAPLLEQIVAITGRAPSFTTV
ncbi:TIGR03086 family metal-binding protein [Kibdelosporangium philippinense]|uniref:TIGR03086 family metal-binding protein n=1 Tax=Kibdelosporangium philippinense TaxID=211113 RepID=A0ABS8ZQG0_9PSEU|nr:TIGR03086 family metal-binding protein [Kibdelosporangium philippinense]MCE7009819.1 TIGR03086 family metal-binding protein [Kibdelosporangium philippinense]